jgi:aldehyde:ferredoxin oxidoreductase
LEWIKLLKLIEEKEKEGKSLEEAQKEVAQYIKTEEFVKKVLGEEVAKKVLEGL